MRTAEKVSSLLHVKKPRLWEILWFVLDQGEQIKRLKMCLWLTAHCLSTLSSHWPSGSEFEYQLSRQPTRKKALVTFPLESLNGLCWMPRRCLTWACLWICCRSSKSGHFADFGLPLSHKAARRDCGEISDSCLPFLPATRRQVNASTLWVCVPGVYWEAFFPVESLDKVHGWPQASACGILGWKTPGILWRLDWTGAWDNRGFSM